MLPHITGLFLSFWLLPVEMLPLNYHDDRKKTKYSTLRLNHYILRFAQNLKHRMFDNHNKNKLIEIHALNMHIKRVIL